MTNEAIEAAARAMRECQKQKWNLELGFDEDIIELARAAAPALMEEGARLALEAAAELANEYDDKSSLMTTVAIISRLLRNTDPAAIVKGAGRDRD